MRLINKSELHLSLLCIVLIGVICRCWNWTEIPMMHDELSAFFRLDFPDFSTLLKKGVKIDGHPAGVHVFLYYWKALVGDSPQLLKLPFILFGLGAIPLVYAIARDWFNPYVGLAVAGSIATLQYPILYSQIIRPYSPGLFFALLLVYAWTRFLFFEKSVKHFSYALFIVAASACTYTHYFAFLFALIVGVTGIFMVDKKTWKPYFLSPLFVLALFLPHWDIFRYQLAVGGLGWLGRPSTDFCIQHVYFIFQYSILGVLLPILFSFSLYKRGKSIIFFRLLAILWFGLPLGIGYFYSVYYKPVLQPSVLLFSFPFLLIFLFSFINQEPNKKLFYTGLCFILGVNLYNLVYTRQHYQVFYHQPFSSFASSTAEFLKEHQVEDLTTILKGNPDYINYYFKHVQKGSYSLFQDLAKSPQDFDAYVRQLTTPYLALGDVPMDYIEIAKKYYPYCVLNDEGFTYNYYVFSKDSTEEKVKLVYQTIWPKKHSNSFNLGEEWGMDLKVDLDSLLKSCYTMANIRLKVKGDKQSNARVVCTLHKGDSLYFYYPSTYFSAYMNSSVAWGEVAHPIRLNNYLKQKADLEDLRLHCYIWNEDKKPLEVTDFRLELQEANPVIYGLFEPLGQ